MIAQFVGGLGFLLMSMMLTTEGLRTATGSAMRKALPRFTRGPFTAMRGPLGPYVLRDQSFYALARLVACCVALPLSVACASERPAPCVPGASSSPAPVVLKPEVSEPERPVQVQLPAVVRPRGTLSQTSESEYLVPEAPVVELLSTPPEPTPLVHATARRLALIFTEGTLPLQRLAQPTLGLAGVRITPANHTRHGRALISRIEVRLLDDVNRVTILAPPDGALLDSPVFSPKGRYLAASVVWSDRVQLVIYDLDKETQQLVAASLNSVWGDPCSWSDVDHLLCHRLIETGEPDGPAAPSFGPTIVEHVAGMAPSRGLRPLLQDANDDRLFERHFRSELIRVAADGEVSSLGMPPAINLTAELSPNGEYLVTTQLLRPYSRMVTAERFPRRVRIWNIQTQQEIAQVPLPDGGAWPTRGYPLGARAVRWDPALPETLVWIEARSSGGARRDHLLSWTAPFDDNAVEVAQSTPNIVEFAWTSAHTLYFRTVDVSKHQTATFAVLAPGATSELWRGPQDQPRFDPTTALRTNGTWGPVLEFQRGTETGRLYFDVTDKRHQGAEIGLNSAALGASTLTLVVRSPTDRYQRVVSVLDPVKGEVLVAREQLNEPASYFVVQRASSRAVVRRKSPYPQLVGVRRRSLVYRRKDGVRLTGMLYLPPGYQQGDRIPTVLWIYPSDYSDEAYAAPVEQHRFWAIGGPSRFALLLQGYALLDQPSMPIIGVPGKQTDSYLPQLISSAEAAVDHLVAIGVADPERIAVAGRSYGAFSAANLLVHTDLFRTAIAISGAYNRTLTPFGFQNENRSFWEATELYTRVSPFFQAHRFTRPLLLIHGQEDENPGTPPMQSERFFRALAGNGVPVRWVSMPFEGHQYRGHESVLHVTAEMTSWLDRQLR